MDFRHFQVSYEIADQYKKRAAYFSMEFAVHQALKIYSGGLGFLSGSHLRSAYELKQNMVGIGILWKYGYYDQMRNPDRTMNPVWTEKVYSFLEDTGIKFQIPVHGSPVWVKAFYLPPHVFNTAPLFLLSTDLHENDYVSQTICHRLYDANVSTKLAQFILLGIGGAKLMDEIGFNPEVYHLNEAHGLSAAFYLLDKFKSLGKLKEHLVFTTHTPEEAGNEKHDIYLCHKMGYFYGLNMSEVRSITKMQDDRFNHSLVALRFARKANGVSKLHGVVSRKMWEHYEGICHIADITNAQNFNFWSSEHLYSYMESGDNVAFDKHKKDFKINLLDIVADQSGKIFNPNVFTIVWARRFAGYKRADMLTYDLERFERLLNNSKYPIQVIWAGKPYPLDTPGIDTFNSLVRMATNYKNVTILTGYELLLSKVLKRVADLWLNNPRVPREASGTSGMSAAMNGAVNFSTDDGWIPEFARHGENSFIIPKADYENMSTHDQDEYDLNKLYDILENEILPTFYGNPDRWRQIIQNAMRDVREKFDSGRMAHEYYSIMYNG